MSPDPPPTPPPDPLLQAQEQAAQQANVAALTQTAQGDTASLMARYGTRLALASSTGGTTTAAPTGSPLAMTGFWMGDMGALAARAGRT